MAEKRASVQIASEQFHGPFWSDESRASIRKHYVVNLDDLRGLLALQGLHVITDADKAVLDAMRDVSDTELLTYERIPFPGAPSPTMRAACAADLARRGLT
jgi:hypothetical protein